MKLLKKKKFAQLGHKYALEVLKVLEIEQSTFSSLELKSFWHAHHYFAYEQAISSSLLLAAAEQNKEVARSTFAYAEQSKANRLQSKIRETRTLTHGDFPKYYLNKEKQIRTKITNLEKQAQYLRQHGKEEYDEALLYNGIWLSKVHQQYDSLKNELVSTYPDYFKNEQDLSTVSLNYVQENLLNKDETLIEYFLGDSSLYICVVRPDHYEVKKIRIDSTLNINISKMTKAGIFGFYSAPASRQSRRAKARADKNYTEAAHELYQMLVAPVKDQLTDKLIIIPDGALGYLPFEALLAEAPKEDGDFSTHHYLLEDHQISYAYSATLLQVMKDKKHRQEPEGERLAMAPFYRGDADTLIAHIDTTDLGFGFVLRDSLAVLAQSGPEVKSITTGEKDLAIYGKDATLACFQNSAPDFRTLHLSSHAHADDRSGDYAYLAFSQPGKSSEFAKLYARDLYNMSLNADMVVLSACETGVGELQRGEGIVSLARAFAYAGAKSIMTTLWKVEENATRELVVDFYKYLDKGREKDEALRLAKLEYLQGNAENNTLSHPFFWASMIGIGDMRPIIR